MPLSTAVYVVFLVILLWASLVMGNHNRIQSVIINRNRALDTLKSKLKSDGYDVYYPPDLGSTEYKVGAEIWVPMPKGLTAKELIWHRKKIKAINEFVGSNFNLTPVGIGPVLLENSLYFVCCGFRRPEK